MADHALPDCPVCANAYLAIRTDIYKDKREFVYCDCCGAMATMPLWIAAQPLAALEPPVAVQEEGDAKDAARYRWLRENSLSIGGSMWFTVDDEAQVAIDAAMKGDQP